jgi:D-xylose transport system substrate-binding protein
MRNAFLALALSCVAVTSAAWGGEDVTIGLALPTLREASWQFTYRVAQEYAKEKGIPMLAQAADADQAQQTRQVEDLLTKGIDALIIGPADGAAAAVLANQCKEEGVPVICYDRIITNTQNVDYYVAINPRRLGEFQGQYIADHAKPGAIMLFGGSPDDSNSIHYFEGAMSKIQPKIADGTFTVIGGDAYTQVVTEGWLPEKAQARAENILAANPDAKVTGILSPNDGLAGGIIQALKANGVTDYIITGQDAEVAAIQRLKTGEQSMTIFVSTKKGVEVLVDVAVQAAKGEKVATNGVLNNGVKDVPAFLTDPTIMTKDNWKRILQENDLYDPAVHGE